MDLIIDTNIIFSSILNPESNISKIIFQNINYHQFYSSNYLKFEINKHLDKLMKLSYKKENEIEQNIDLLFSKIIFIQEEIIPKEILILAEKFTIDIDYNDVLFVALSIFINANLWTGDKKLLII